MLTYNAVVRGQSIRPEDVLSFSSDIPKAKLDALFTELCVPWWVESEGKKRVVPKAKLKKELGVKSHTLLTLLLPLTKSRASLRWLLGADCLSGVLGGRGGIPPPLVTDLYAAHTPHQAKI